MNYDNSTENVILLNPARILLCICLESVQDMSLLGILRKMEEGGFLIFLQSLTRRGEGVKIENFLLT